MKTRLANMKGEIERIQRKVQSEIFETVSKLDDIVKEIADLAKRLNKMKGLSREDKASLKDMADTFSAGIDLGDNFEEYKKQKEQLEQGEFDFEEHTRARIRDVFEEFQVKPDEKEQRNIRKVFFKIISKVPSRFSKKMKKKPSSFTTSCSKSTKLIKTTIFKLYWI